jgi:hypothetical protein
MQLLGDFEEIFFDFGGFDLRFQSRGRNSEFGGRSVKGWKSRGLHTANRAHLRVGRAYHHYQSLGGFPFSHL